MNSDFATAMGRALERTRAGDPGEATRIIQAALAGRVDETHSAPPRPQDAPHAMAIEDAEVVEDRPRATEAAPSASRRGGRKLGAVIAALRRGKSGLFRGDQGKERRPAPVLDVPAGARWEWRRFESAEGARDYRLYVPSALAGTPRGLIVMLHGCTQGADDFAVGTRMNTEAERHSLILAYPEQGRALNAQACWNWFRPGDQRRAGGEPAIMAGLAASLADEFAIDRAHVFAAGLSAGGAMAATLAVTHPDVFRAIGVHSGLPHGAASDVVTAFAAMRGEGGPAPAAAPAVPLIVFHGTADATVHPSNAERILAGVEGASARSDGVSPGGRRFTRSVTTGADGAAAAELWLVEGAGHAWSGGATAGTYTDPQGPDASEAMVRFFLARAAGGVA
jgi:poly(hydroxyalkanoate) depolymerase family esterase